MHAKCFCLKLLGGGRQAGDLFIYLSFCALTALGRALHKEVSNGSNVRQTKTTKQSKIEHNLNLYNENSETQKKRK